MKYCVYLLFFTIFSCNNKQPKISGSKPPVFKAVEAAKDSIKQMENEICWSGMLDGKTPVFLHYQVDSSVVVGEITYKNTQDELPITLLGTIQDDSSYRLLEFEKSGNITGIITGLPNKNTFEGNWFSPKTRKTFTVNLQMKDTVIKSNVVKAEFPDIFGKYHYQYTEAGNQGNLEITELPGSKASFNISSFTSAPARNLATVNNDTIPLTATHFIYHLPHTNNCAFAVTFYKSFAVVTYTNGPCVGQFGNNATVEGIYLKTD